MIPNFQKSKLKEEVDTNSYDISFSQSQNNSKMVNHEVPMNSKLTMSCSQGFHLPVKEENFNNTKSEVGNYKLTDTLKSQNKGESY